MIVGTTPFFGLAPSAEPVRPSTERTRRTTTPRATCVIRVRLIQSGFALEGGHPTTLCVKREGRRGGMPASTRYLGVYALPSHMRGSTRGRLGGGRARGRS